MRRDTEGTGAMSKKPIDVLGELLFLANDVTDIDDLRELFFGADEPFTYEIEQQYPYGARWYVVAQKDDEGSTNGFVITIIRDGIHTSLPKIELSEDVSRDFELAVDALREEYETPDTREQDIPSAAARNRIFGGRVL